MGEAISAMQDVHDIKLNDPDMLSLHDRIIMLNEDQNRAFDRISYHLQQYPVDES